MREISIDDITGFRLRFGQIDFAFENQIVFELADLNARIEKRVVNVLNDLAIHKKMSIGEVLEETLLHFFAAIEGLAGQGVASPHTQRTLGHISELKTKHGVESETRDAYRFSEAEEPE